MEAPPRYREPVGLPSIHIESNPRSSDRSDYGMYSSSAALSIPGSDRGPVDAPPPLPPPRMPFEQHNPMYQEPRQWHRDPSSYSPRDASGYGSMNSFDERPNYKGAGHRHDRDEGYASLSSGSSRSECSLPSIAAGFGLHHNKFQFQSGADAFTDMKKKLDPLKTFDNKMSVSLLSASSASATDPFTRRLSGDQRAPPLSLPTTSLPYHLKTNMLDSPDRLTQTPQSAVSPSPRSQPFHLGDYRSPRSVSDLDRSPPQRSRRNNSDDASSHGYEEVDMEMEETNSMKRLRIEDPIRAHYDGAGAKRRASADPDDSVPIGFTTQGDLIRRRDGNSRGSPTPRLTAIPQGSVSSVSSSGRAGSYSSNLSLLTGSIASMNTSYGRVSPGGLSPGGISPNGTDPSCSSPYSASMSLNPSPRGSLSRAPHQRTISESRPLASPRKLAEVSKPGNAKISGFFMCDCCPKKPKKFETPEELQAHESEKQYECSFCGNRFKNKNEAERHQNSLHVRRHSWSCSALNSYDRAFHDSTNRPGEADTCGYCGEEFPRNGRGPGATAPRHATDQDWEERIRHLQEVHKFRECNASKKFYRADHFRQHLKHSHAGTSGKWTNMLENACMLDEDPTPR